MEDQQQWKLVPVEPTEEMVKVGTDARWQSALRNPNSVREIWAAMLAASPSSSVLERAREALLGLVELAEDHWPNGATSRKGRAALAEIDRALGGGNAE